MKIRACRRIVTYAYTWSSDGIRWWLRVELWPGYEAGSLYSLYIVGTTPMSSTPWSGAGLSPCGVRTGVLCCRKLLNWFWLVAWSATSVTSDWGKSPSRSEEGSSWLFRERSSSAYHFLSCSLCRMDTQQLMYSTDITHTYMVGRCGGVVRRRRARTQYCCEKLCTSHILGEIYFSAQFHHQWLNSLLVIYLRTVYIVRHCMTELILGYLLPCWTSSYNLIATTYALYIMMTYIHTQYSTSHTQTQHKNIYTHRHTLPLQNMYAHTHKILPAFTSNLK